MSILSVVFDNIACPNCKSVGLCLDEKAKQGLAFKFILCCKDDDCLWSYTFFNCKRNKKKKSIQSKMYEINPRVVYSMRRCGKGYSRLKRFLMLMNHPPPMSESSLS